MNKRFLLGWLALLMSMLACEPVIAVGRNEIDFYIRRPETYTGRRTPGAPIPDKFKSIDTDKDNYISFDEMLKEIDRFFDFESDLTANDIYELNSFFFSQ